MRIIWPTKGSWRRGTVDYGKYTFIQLEIFNYAKGIKFMSFVEEPPEWEDGIKDRVSKRFWRYIGAM
jgi:hypothetical protein